jgi:hypothetical protein
MTQVITAATGFLVAVLWFDLIFDVQVLPHGRSLEVPEQVLDSISAYYRRVTTTASPMGRLVALTMLVLLAALVTQAARADAAVWVSAVSLSAAVLAIGLAVGRVFGAARRLGAGLDSPEVRSRLARSILRDHLICVTAMAALLAVQLAAV